MKITFPHFKNIFSRKHTSPMGAYNPRRDWKIILLSFSALAVVMAAFSLYIFFKINSGEIFRVTGERVNRTEAVNRTLLEETIHRFEAKKERLEKLQAGGSLLIDPSL